MGQVASVAMLWHPASRYRFTGHFWAMALNQISRKN
jgi:hypothetical protein